MPYNGTTPPPKPQDPDLAKLHKRSGCPTWLFVTGGVFLSFAIVIGGCAAILVHGLDNLNFDSTPRHHLQAIPISASACPNVVVMHQTAYDFERAMPFLGIGFDKHGKLMPWWKTKARLLRATNRLDFAVVASTPKLPPRVQRYLTTVHKDLTLGRRRLIKLRDGARLSERMQGLIDDGQTAFGYAGDLIGKQCRVPLGV